MIEKDMAHLRFLHTQVMKGHYLDNNDIAFIIDKKAELSQALTAINEMLVLREEIEMML